LLTLYHNRLPVSLVEPIKIRSFAKAKGILAKTDNLDAKVLAEYALAWIFHEYIDGDNLIVYG
jgi:transposase